MYNSLRDFPILPGSDNGLNITHGENKRAIECRKEMELVQND